MKYSKYLQLLQLSHLVYSNNWHWCFSSEIWNCSKPMLRVCCRNCPSARRASAANAVWHLLTLSVNYAQSLITLGAAKEFLCSLFYLSFSSLYHVMHCWCSNCSGSHGCAL